MVDVCLTFSETVALFPHPQCIRVSIILHSSPIFEILSIFISNILIDVKWFPQVILIFMSLMTSEGEHSFYVCLLPMYVFGRVKIFSPFETIGLVVFILLNFESALHVLDKDPSLCDLKISFPYSWLLFSLFSWYLLKSRES